MPVTWKCKFFPAHQLPSSGRRCVYSPDVHQSQRFPIPIEVGMTHTILHQIGVGSMFVKGSDEKTS